MTEETVHLSRGSTSVVLDTTTPGVPAIVYWGCALGHQPREALDALAVAARNAGATVRLLDYFAPEPVELARLTASGERLSRPDFAPWPLRPTTSSAIG